MKILFVVIVSMRFYGSLCNPGSLDHDIPEEYGYFFCHSMVLMEEALEHKRLRRRQA